VPITDTTTNRAYQKPNIANALTDDVGRIRAALDSIDTDMTTCLGGTFTSVNVGLGAVGTPSYTFTGDLNTGMWSPAADTLAFSTAGVDRFRFDPNGYSFYTYDSTSLGVGGITWRTGTSNESVFTMGVSTSLGKAFLTSTHNGSGTSQPLCINTGGSNLEVCRFTTSQELWVGYTSDNGAYKLQVNSQIFATSATIATSDLNYKTDVEALTGGYEMVKALRPITFTWIQQEDIVTEDGTLIREGHNFPTGRQLGFGAQEVQAALGDHPWISNLIKQNCRPEILADDGTVLAPEEPFLGIAEGNLIAVLTSALKEAIDEIESLKVRVLALESP
jgi:hypothetical protein